MYSWKAIRIACTILLLLPIVHVVYLVSRDTLETLDASPDAWAREISDYAATDTKGKLPQNPIVVIGGHRVKLWPDLAELLAPRPVLMRGVGDAIVEDITANYSRLVGFYQPETLVLLPSNSEFHIRDSKSAEALVAAIKELAKLDGSYEITQRFYIFAPLKTPLHPSDDTEIDRTTELLRAWADRDPRLIIIDANPLLAGADGKPRPEFYRADGVNLNEHGYLRLSLLLQAQIEANALQGQSVAGTP